MKTLYLIGGAMGVGKTAVCQQMKQMLPNSVFLDGDWCWDASPFVVTDETKTMVVDNICYLLNNFIHCSAYKNIVFCWVMHQQYIIDKIMNDLDTSNCNVKIITLMCDEKTLRQRLQQDIDRGIRQADIIERAFDRLSCCQQLGTTKINATDKSVDTIAKEIIAR